VPEMRRNEEYITAFGFQRAERECQFAIGIVGIGPCEWRGLLRRRMRLSLTRS
jgi:hypothetical protein